MKKKRLLYSSIILLFMVLIGAMAAGLYISKQLSVASRNDLLWEDGHSVESHILVIVDDSSQTYDKSFEMGIYESADAYKIAVEIKRLDQNNYVESLLSALDKALYAKMDGVVAHTIEDPRVVEKVNVLYQAGIPVVTLNQDIPESQRIAYVGVNRYDIGYMAGLSLWDVLDETGNIVVIAEEGSNLATNTSDDMILLGLKDVLKENTDLTLQSVEYTKQGVLGAETLALDIIRSDETVSAFFCTSSANTLGVVQMLVDNNMVNDIQLVGIGKDPEIIDYISKGNIVDATVVTDYGDIGRQSILALVEYDNKGFVSNYINTEMLIVDDSNLHSYMQTIGDSYEE